MNDYRINYQNETIYKFSAEHNAYLYFGSFAQYNVARKNRESTIIRRIEAA